MESEIMKIGVFNGMYDATGNLLGMFVGIPLSIVIWIILFKKLAFRIYKRKRIFIVTTVALTLLVLEFWVLYFLSNKIGFLQVIQEKQFNTTFDEMMMGMLSKIRWFVGAENGWFARGTDITYSVGFLASFVATLIFSVELIVAFPIVFAIKENYVLIIVTLVIDCIYLFVIQGPIQMRKFKNQMDESSAGLSRKELKRLQREWNAKNGNSFADQYSALSQEETNNRDKTTGAENLVDAFLNKEKEAIGQELKPKFQDDESNKWTNK